MPRFQDCLSTTPRNVVKSETTRAYNTLYKPIQNEVHEEGSDEYVLERVRLDDAEDVDIHVEDELFRFLFVYIIGR